ncbi:MAG: type II toxin-antitoxin system RelB/DinJ family antitoxin [Candidatus Gracilibacteria bacterium]|nr:type II toxin-antitoxin system RelB/DinJ family antitoxin [Candidatus Gracilibacteria bacterium]
MTTTARRDTTYQIRIDELTKKESFNVFHDLGITPAEGIRVFLRQVANTHSIPFSIHVPNEKTRKVLDNARSGIDVHTANNADDLFHQLGM